MSLPTIFPVYPDTSGSRVSQRRINQAKGRVAETLARHEDVIRRAFQRLEKRGKNKKRKGARRIVCFPERAMCRVASTRLCPASEHILGESDDTTIYIAANKLNDAMLEGTILHEALHYYAEWEDEHDICTKDEHMVMRWLGEKI